MKDFWEKWEYLRWLGDQSVGRASARARGVWIEVLCVMMSAETYQLSGSLPQLARLLRLDVAELDTAFQELSSVGICEVSEHVIEQGQRIVSIVSRKRLRDYKLRESNRLAKQRERSKSSVIPSSSKKKITSSSLLCSSLLTGEGHQEDKQGVDVEENRVESPPTRSAGHPGGSAAGAAKIVLEMHALAYRAFPKLAVPAIPNEFVKANCVELLRRYTEAMETLKLLAEWLPKSRREKGLPESPRSLTDPDRFDQWVNMMLGETQGKLQTPAMKAKRREELLAKLKECERMIQKRRQQIADNEGNDTKIRDCQADIRAWEATADIAGKQLEKMK